MRSLGYIASNYGRFAAGMLSVLVVTPFAIRELGIEAFGIWSLASAICGFLLLMEAGIATAATRYACSAAGSNQPQQRNVILSTLLALLLPIAVFVLLIGWTSAAWIAAMLGLRDAHAADFIVCVHIVSSALAITLPLNLWRAALASEGCQHHAHIADAIAILCAGATTLYALHCGQGLRSMALGAALTALLPVPLLWWSVHKKVAQLSLSLRLASLQAWREMRSFTGAAAATNFANLAAQRMEPALVNTFLPLAAVGQYAAAVRIAEYALLLARQLSNALTPFVARAHGAGNENSIRDTLLVGTRWQLALITPCAALLILHAPQLLHIWLGDSVLAAATALRLLAVAAVLAALGMNCAMCLGMTGLHHQVAGAALIGAAVRLGSGTLAMQSLGLSGIGLAAILAAFSVDVCWLVRRACHRFGVSISEFATQAVWPALPGLGVLAVIDAVFTHTQATDSLMTLLVQCLLAAAAYWMVFAYVALPNRAQLMDGMRAGLARLYARKSEKTLSI